MLGNLAIQKKEKKSKFHKIRRIQFRGCNKPYDTEKNAKFSSRKITIKVSDIKILN